VLAPLRIDGPVHFDSRSFPASSDRVGIVHEEIRTRSAVLIGVRYDTEVDLDVIRYGKSVATTAEPRVANPRRA
jgi:hypothetical protein